MTGEDLIASLNLTLIVFGHIFIIAFISWLIMRYVSKITHKGSYAAVFAFGSLGGFLGYTVASSRESIAGLVLPALLTLITAMLGYIFSRDNLKTWRSVIPFCISVLVLNSFLGLLSGSIIRKKHELYEKKYQEHLTKEKDYWEIRKEKEKRILQSKTIEELEKEIAEEDQVLDERERLEQSVRQ